MSDRIQSSATRNVPVSDVITVQRARLITLVCYAAFVMLGITGTILGPVLPELASRYHFPLGQAGIIPALQAGGVFLGVLCSGWLADRLNPRTILLIGALALITGLAGFGLAGTLGAAFLAIMISGYGFGMLNVTPNVVIAMLYPANATAALSTLNVFSGIGAIVGPQIASFALGQGDYTLAYRIVPVMGLGLILLILTIHLPGTTHTIPPIGPTAQNRGIRWSVVLPFVLVIFLYVSVEAGNGSWIATQMEKAALSSVTTGALATSLFWAGITLGRFIAGIALRRIRDMQFLIGGIVLIVISAAVLLIFGHIELIGLICAVFLGLGCAATFPITFGKAILSSPKAHGAVSGVMLATASLGAIFGPWVQGLISGPHDGGVIYTLIVGILLLCAAIWASRRIYSDRTG